MVVPIWCWRVIFLVLVVRARAQRSSPFLPQSPCPRLFYYYEDSRTSQFLGALNVPPPFNSVNVSIQAHFIVASLLETNYYGEIELIEDVNSVVNRLQQHNLQDIRFAVHFPIQNPLPELTNLTVNNELICIQNTDYYKPPYTKLWLTRVLYVTTESAPHDIGPINIMPPTSFFSTTSKVPMASPAMVDVEKRFPDNLIDAECGRSVQVEPLVVNGSPVNKGAWPWLTAIFWTVQSGLEFKCGGTLISRNHILTAAHCVTDLTNKMIDAKTILIYLGKYDLFDWKEPNVQTIDVSRIVIPSGYDIRSPGKGNDIAVLFLSTPAIFNLYVRPACLWNPQNSYSNLGSVVGWGVNENNKLSKSPKLAVLPIVSDEVCLRSKIEFHYFTSNTTLCAGARNGVGPCNGDSGGGMYFKARDTDGVEKWFVRAIVSLSLRDPNTVCDLKNFIVFTDLSKLDDWINKVMGSSQQVRMN